MLDFLSRDRTTCTTVMTDRRVVFWDFDGTLARRDGGWTVSLHRVLLRNGITHVAVERLRPLMQTGFPWHLPDVPHVQLLGGLSWWEYLQRLLAGVLVQVGIGGSAASVLASQVRGEYLDLAYWSLYDDAVDALTAVLATGCRNCVLSNHVPELRQLVDELGLAPYLDDVLTSGLLGFEKPNERIYKLARSAMGNPSECFMVGDSYRADVQGAIACGMRAVLVHRPNDQGHLHYSEDLRGAARLIGTALPARQLPPSASGRSRGDVPPV